MNNLKSLCKKTFNKVYKPNKKNHFMTDYSKTLIKGTSILFVATFLTSLISYLLRVFLARNLSITEFGLVYSIISLFGIFLILPGTGSGRALIRFITEERAQKNFKELKTTIKTGFITNLIISTIIGLLFIIFSKQIAINYLHDPATAKYIIIYAIGFILTPTFGIFKAIFMGFKQTKYYSLLDFSKMLGILILAYTFIRLNLGVLGVMLAYVLVYFLPILFYLLFTKKTFPTYQEIKAKLNVKKAKEILKFGIPLTIASVAGIIFGYIDTVMITFFRTLEEVALYNVGLPTIKIMWNFEKAISVILLPIVIELWLKKDNLRFIKAIKNLYKYIFIIAMPMIIVLLTFPELILKILFGQGYIEASEVVRILAIASIIIIFARINLSIITGIGDPKKIGKAMLIGAIINLAINLVLIPLIGINGAAISTAAAFSFILVYTNKTIKDIAKIEFPLGKIIKILFASVISVVIIYLLKKAIEINIYLEAVIILAIVAIVYTTLLFLLKVVTKPETENLIKKAFK